MRKLIFIGAIALVALATTGSKMIRGKVGYPATEKSVIVESDDSIFLIPTDQLTADELKQFQNTGSSINIPSRSGVIRYPLHAKRKQSGPSRTITNVHPSK